MQPSIISVSSVASACEHLDIEHIEAGMSTSFSIDKISEFVHVASLEFDGTTTHTYIHIQSHTHIYIYTYTVYTHGVNKYIERIREICMFIYIYLFGVLVGFYPRVLLICDADFGSSSID